jgi:hypothetical protein
MVADIVPEALRGTAYGPLQRRAGDSDSPRRLLPGVVAGRVGLGWIWRFRAILLRRRTLLTAAVLMMVFLKDNGRLT